MGRFRSEKGMQERVQNSTEPGVIVCISVKPLALGKYQMWLRNKAAPLPYIPSYRTNVIGADLEPSCWIGSAFDYLHFHIPQAELEAMAEDLKFSSIESYRLSINEEDLVVAQLAKTLLPYTAPEGSPSVPGLSPLALDRLNLILGAHVLQKYAVARRVAVPARGGLAPWQRRRATELLRENLDGRLRLAELSKECNLSVSHFARSFKTTFGISTHQWLIQRRIERAKELLAKAEAPLVDVAVQCGFGDQAAFTRSFHQAAGTSPGRWRRDHGSH